MEDLSPVIQKRSPGRAEKGLQERRNISLLKRLSSVVHQRAILLRSFSMPVVSCTRAPGAVLPISGRRTGIG
jgi:hypothetical protein